MKKTIFVTLILFIFSLPLLAQTRMAYIDSEKLRKEFKEFSDAQAQFDKEVESWQKDAESQKTEIEGLQDEYDRQALLLSEDKRQEMEMRIRDKRKGYETYLASLFGDQGKAQARNAELTRPLLDRINKALQDIAQTEHIDIVFDISGGGVAYAKPDLDLTDKLIEKLNKSTK